MQKVGVEGWNFVKEGEMETMKKESLGALLTRVAALRDVIRSRTHADPTSKNCDHDLYCAKAGKFGIHEVIDPKVHTNSLTIEKLVSYDQKLV